uniref:hypothetical protein n=1 Tax=uncultured Ruminococcus sp. TaxID=165186 RepID=UPI0025F86348|nr:hypothetical protein [uncultured Ruminococcus sp.]
MLDFVGAYRRIQELLKQKEVTESYSLYAADKNTSIGDFGGPKSIRLFWLP